MSNQQILKSKMDELLVTTMEKDITVGLMDEIAYWIENLERSGQFTNDEAAIEGFIRFNLGQGKYFKTIEKK